MPKSPLVNVACPSCGHRTTVEYRRLGVETVCAGCGARTTPRVPSGGTWPVIQWDLSFADFLRLVREDYGRTQVEALFRTWFGYHIIGRDAGSRIADRSDRVLDPLDVHLRIQDDDEKQHALYQLSQTLWR